MKMKKGRNRLHVLFYMIAFMFFMNAGNVYAQVEGSDSVYVEPEDSVVTEEVAVDDTIEKVSNIAPSQEEHIRQRLKKLEKTVPLIYNEKIQSFIDYFTIRNPHYCRIMERRRNMYFPIFEEYLKRYNIPDEIKYLAIVESGLNPLAISRAGAAGLWQFMPYTGKQFGLRQDEYIDERLDPYKSTEAACKYLKELYNSFHDWELALASYNCGPGGVRRAIRRSGYKDTFWKVYYYLPSETRGYVPQFVAITYTMNNMNEYKIPADSLDYPIKFDTIQISTFMNLERFCDRMNICMDEMRELNPALKRSEVPAYLQYALRVPKDKMLELHLNRDEIIAYCSVKADSPLVFMNTRGISSSTSSTAYRTKIYHSVRRGESLGVIAGKYRVNVTDIKRWNGLRSSTIYPGQKLVIYRNSTAKPTYTASTPGAAGTTKIYHIVKSGETLGGIAEKYGTTVTNIKSWNGMTGTTIYAGQKLAIYKKSTTTTTAPSTQSASTGTIPKYYTVRSGDTLWSISQRYSGLTVETIKKLNNLKDNNVKVGQTLQLN